MAHSSATCPVQPTRVAGSGPIKVVVCHGWMGDHTLFDTLLSQIDGERFTYAFLDARGYGARADESGPMTVQAIAEDMLSVADGLDWQHFHVAGHSMAGMSAQWLMAKAPDRLRSAILIAPVPASGAAIDDHRRNLLLRAIGSPEIRRQLIDANTGQRQDSMILDQILRCSLRSTRAEAMQRYMTSWTGVGFEQEVVGSAVPVLVIVGRFDPGATADRMRPTVLAWYPNARLCELADAGHYPMIESPAEFAAAMAEWLAAHEH